MDPTLGALVLVTGILSPFSGAAVLVTGTMDGVTQSMEEQA